MQAGRTDTRMSFDRKSVEQDATYGTEIITWVRHITAWVEFQDVMPSRSESVQQGLAVARNQSRVRMRYRNDITSDMRAVRHGDEDVVYQIVGGPAEIMGRKNMIELVLERFSSGGL
jgi:SPP1 family predicted phage head-tail adaptor